MYYLNEYYKSHAYELVMLKEKRLNLYKYSFCVPQLCAEFLERIVRTIRGFTVVFQLFCPISSLASLPFLSFIYIYIINNNDQLRVNEDKR